MRRLHFQPDTRCCWSALFPHRRFHQTDYHRNNAQNRDHNAPGYALPGILRDFARLETFCAGDDLNHRGDRHKDGTGAEKTNPLCLPASAASALTPRIAITPAKTAMMPPTIIRIEVIFKNFCPLFVVFFCFLVVQDAVCVQHPLSILLFFEFDGFAVVRKINLHDQSATGIFIRSFMEKGSDFPRR